MKNLFKTLMIIALIAMISLSAISCATASAASGAIGVHGLISGGKNSKLLTEGFTEIASYSTILFLVDTGYDEYAKKVREAQAAGKKISSIVTNYFVMYKTTAYAK
jgi:hypothetical protein